MSAFPTNADLLNTFNDYYSRLCSTDKANEDLFKAIIKAKKDLLNAHYRRLTVHEDKRTMSEDHSNIMEQKNNGDVCLLVGIDPIVSILFDNEEKASNTLKQALGDNDITTDIWEMTKNESPQKLSFVLRGDEKIAESLKPLVSEFFAEKPRIYNRRGDIVFILDKIYKNREEAAARYNEFKTFLAQRHNYLALKISIDIDPSFDLAVNAVMRLLPEFEKIRNAKALREKLIQGSDINVYITQNINIGDQNTIINGNHNTVKNDIKQSSDIDYITKSPPDGKINAGKYYDDYKKHCLTNGLGKPIDVKKFAKSLEDSGFKREVHRDGRKYWSK